MTRRDWRWAVVAAAVLVVAAGCSSDDSGQPAVVIGAVYNLTGAQSALDVPSAAGARLAVDETNSAGGVLGRRVELAVADGQTDARVIQARVLELLSRDDAMPGLIGLSDTDMVLAAAPLAAAADRLFVTSGATSPQLPAEVPQWLYLACFGDNVQAAAAAEWAYGERSARTASILYSTDSSYTTLLQGYFRSRFEQLGGEIASVTSYAIDDLDEDTVRDVAAADVIYLSAQPDDGVAAAQLLRAAGFTAPILGGDGLDTDAWADHPEIDDLFFTTHAYLGADSQDEQVRAFLEAYDRAHTGETPDAFTALGYDTVRLLLDAIARAGSTAPSAVREALAATQGFEGVTGTISYTDGERIPSKSVTILGIEAGARNFVAELVPEVVPDP